MSDTLLRQLSERIVRIHAALVASPLGESLDSERLARWVAGGALNPAASDALIQVTPRLDAIRVTAEGPISLLFDALAAHLDALAVSESERLLATQAGQTLAPDHISLWLELSRAALDGGYTLHGTFERDDLAGLLPDIFAADALLSWARASDAAAVSWRRAVGDPDPATFITFRLPPDTFSAACTALSAALDLTLAAPPMPSGPTAPWVEVGLAELGVTHVSIGDTPPPHTPMLALIDRLTDEETTQLARFVGTLGATTPCAYGSALTPDGASSWLVYALPSPA